MDTKRFSSSIYPWIISNRVLHGFCRILPMKRPARTSFATQIFSILVLIVLVGCNLSSAAPKAAEKTTSPVTTAITPVSSPPLPAPPKPLEVASQDPEKDAGTIVNALAGQDSLAAWLGLYQALGIPVIGEDHKSLDGRDDPIGPPYWLVWYTASLDIPGHGIRLSDAGRLMGVIIGLNQQDSQALGDLLLTDLRSAQQSENASVHLLGAVARERIRRSGLQVDILDSAATAQTASIDGPMFQVIFWWLLRETLYLHPAQTGFGPGLPGLANIRLDRSFQQAKPFNCSEAWGDSDSTYWANWIINKAFGGIQLPGMEEALPSILEIFLKQMYVSKEMIKDTGKAIGYANAAGGAVSMLMQLASLDVVGIQDPDQLERTKHTGSDGKSATITWRLMSDPGRLPNGNDIQACFISYLTNVLGVGFTFPGGGRIAGAELDFEAGVNIPERVLFGDSDKLRSFTNQNGEAVLPMLGKAQSEEKPDSAKPENLEYSIYVSAQPEESGLNSMVNLFFDGLTVGAAPSPAGILSSLVDMLKTFTFDLGEHVFPMIDWGQKAYRASGGIKMSMVGTICDLETGFELVGVGGNGVTYQFNFSPANDTSGNMDYSGSSEGCTESAEGTYTVQLKDDGSTGTITFNVSGSVDCPGLSAPFSGSESFDLTLDPAASCP